MIVRILLPAVALLAAALPCRAATAKPNIVYILADDLGYGDVQAFNPEDSVSFLPALLGRDTAPREAVVHHSINGMFGIRQGQWKLNLCAGSGGWGKPGDADATQAGLPSVQLYDLGADPGEKKNLQREHPEIVARLTALLERYVAEGRSTPGSKQANDAAIAIVKEPIPPRGKK